MEHLLNYEITHMLGRLCLAAFLGGLVGLERDVHGRAAGLRTHALVGLGAALFMVLSDLLARKAGVEAHADPTRIAAQIVTGIGFLGAGAIMKEGFTVRGLTTAACFWIVAAVGMAAGAGEYFIALGTTLIALFILSIIHPLDKLYKHDSYRTLLIRTDLDVSTQTLIETVKRKFVSVIFVDVSKDYKNGQKTVTLSLRIFHKGTTDKFSQEIFHALEQKKIPMHEVSWTHRKMD